MALFQQLLSDWVGILSLGTIVFILGMGGYIFRYVMKHMKEE
jgi:hypothetical protein